MSHDPEKIDDAQVIDIDGDDGFEVVASGDRYVVRRRDDRHEIWDAQERTVVRTFEGARGRRNAWFEFKALEGRQHERRRRAKTRWFVVVGLLLAIVLGRRRHRRGLPRSIVGARDRIGPVGRPGRAPRREPRRGLRLPHPAGLDRPPGRCRDGGHEPGWGRHGLGRSGGRQGPRVRGDRARRLPDRGLARGLAGSSSATDRGRCARGVGGRHRHDRGRGGGADSSRSRCRRAGGAFTIAITVHAGADPSRTTPAIDGILSSFRVPTA